MAPPARLLGLAAAKTTEQSDAVQKGKLLVAGLQAQQRCFGHSGAQERSKRKSTGRLAV